MKRFTEMVEACAKEIEEVFPWDLCERMQQRELLLVDVREPYEFNALRIEGSLNIPRGILESAFEYGYEETVPELASAREREVVLICRSGLRSALAAFTLKQMGFEQVCSLKTGLRGWNDYEQPLIDATGRDVELESADEYFMPRLRPEQFAPESGSP